MDSILITSNPQSVKKFYFLDYFYILLKSIESYSNKEKIFDSFKWLKQKYQLGESKYKKLTIENETLSEKQLGRYKYTLNQVIEESIMYGLIQKDMEGKFFLTKPGNILLDNYDENNSQTFYKAIIPYMESKFNAFYYLINFCFKVNQERGGLLFFPIYSPSKLDFNKSDISKTSDIMAYSTKLTKRLEQDIQKYLNKSRDLSDYNKQIIEKLVNVGLLSVNKRDKLASGKYNSIIKRLRDFWLTVFLKEIYKYEYAFFSFDIWIYRAKQIGLFHVTEYYPKLNGRIVYPTSIINNEVISSDFEKLYDYAAGQSLFMHHPSYEDEKGLEDFAKFLTDSYMDIRRTNRNYFVNINDVREMVCYKMKIATYLFDRFLEKSYKLSLHGKLKISISLEKDKIPDETSAMYLKREKTMVDGKYINLIAIDISKGGKKYA